MPDVEPIDAIVLEEILQVPPVYAPESVVQSPRQIVGEPEIGPGVALTVIVLVTMQPEGNK